MKKIITSVILFLSGYTMCVAQPWTLEKCIDHAIAHNLDIKMQEMNHEAKQIDLHTAKSSWLPNLNASAGQSVNLGRAETASGLIVDQNASYNTSFSVSSGMPLFTGFRIKNDIRTKEYSVQAAEESLKRAKENICVAVAQAFLDVLLRKEIYKISEETVKLTGENVSKTEIMVKTGHVPLSQLYEIKSQQASDEARLTSAGNDVSLGLLTLGQLLELQDLETFDVELPALADSATLSSESVASSSKVYEEALNVKPQIRQAELQLEESKYMLKSAESGYWPQLSLSMGISDAYYYAPESAIPAASFSDQMNNNLREYVGVSLQIPIFNRFQVKNSVRSAQVNINNQKLVLENAKKTLYKEIQQAYHNAVAAQKNYNAAQKSVEMSRESFRYADAKYKTGKSSVYELTEAQTLLTRSLAEEVQAKYNYVFAIKILDFYRGKPITL